MKITNKFGLPGAIVEAVRNDDYDACGSDATVTGLLSPPRQKALMKRFSGELVEDASDRIWALVGQAIHSILERAEPSAVTEKRLFSKYCGWNISGQYDRLTLRKKTLQDYKMMSVWEIIYGLKPEKEQQLNMLVQLAVDNGYDAILNLEIIGIFRDWQKSKAKYDKKYPQSQVRRVKVKLWPEEKRIAFINERVKLHQAALINLPECTEDERWATPDKWALMKKGRKSAIKLHSGEESANEACVSKDHYVEYRPGVSRRCEDYCAVSEYCKQFKKIKARL